MQLPALRSRPALLSVSTGVPAAPNRPIAQERSCTSVILRWLPPASTGNCTISGYTVEYREEGVLLCSPVSASSREVFRVSNLRLKIASHSQESAWLGHPWSLTQKPGARLYLAPGFPNGNLSGAVLAQPLGGSVSSLLCPTYLAQSHRKGPLSPCYRWGS